MAKNHHILHIKRHTAGSSNELSFDVLDAKRNNLDAQKSRKEKKGFMLDFRPKPGGVSKGDASARPAGLPVHGGMHMRTSSPATSGSLGTPAVIGGANGAAGSSGKSEKRFGLFKRSKSTTTLGAGGLGGGNPLMPADEVLHLKKKRRRRAVFSYIIVAAVLAVAAGALVWFAVKGHQTQEIFENQFKGVVANIAETDAVLVDIDQMMDDPLGETTAQERALARKESVAVIASADKAEDDLDELSRRAPAEQDKAAIDFLLEGTKGRKAMVGLAMEAFSIADKAEAVRDSARSAWDEVVDADISARDAVAKSNDATTPEKLEEQSEVLSQARDRFAAALAQLEGIQATVDNVDLSAQTAYLEKRIEALDAAKAVNDALIEGNRQAAEEHNAAYNQADRDSASLAAGLPVSIGDIIDAAYTDSMLAVQARYDNERSRVAKADAAVRKYLGIRIE